MSSHHPIIHGLMAFASLRAFARLRICTSSWLVCATTMPSHGRDSLPGVPITLTNLNRVSARGCRATTRAAQSDARKSTPSRRELVSAAGDHLAPRARGAASLGVTAPRAGPQAPDALLGMSLSGAPFPCLRIFLAAVLGSLSSVVRMLKPVSLRMLLMALPPCGRIGRRRPGHPRCPPRPGYTAALNSRGEPRREDHRSPSTDKTDRESQRARATNVIDDVVEKSRN